jgi:hypothetical protein
VSNQYFVHLHSAWLYANYSGQWSVYNATINSQLSTLNNTWQLNQFGFLPESNLTTDIGFDAGYFGVGTVNQYNFYLDSQLPILTTIMQKEENALVNVVMNGSWYLPNSSRGNDNFKGVYDSVMSTVLSNANLSYATQMNYLAVQINTVSGGIWGTSSCSNTLNTNSCPPRGGNYPVRNYIFNTTPISNNFIFPQNYSRYAFDLFNSSALTRRNVSNSGVIKSRTNLEFPLMLVAWNDNTTWWVRGDYLRTNASGWIYSDTNGNFTLSITPQILFTQSDGIVHITTSNYVDVVNTTQTANGISVASNGANRNIISNFTSNVTAQFILNTTGATPSYSVLLSPTNLLTVLNYSYNGTAATFTTNITLQNGNSTVYLSPLNISNISTNVINISSSLAINYTNVTLNISTNGITPSSPRLVLADGTVQNPVYSYDSTAGTMTFNATIEPGTNLLYISEVCGDSVVMGTETCDSGPLNGICPNSCTSSCQLGLVCQSGSGGGGGGGGSGGSSSSTTNVTSNNTTIAGTNTTKPATVSPFANLVNDTNDAVDRNTDKAYHIVAATGSNIINDEFWRYLILILFVGIVALIVTRKK